MEIEPVVEGSPEENIEPILNNLMIPGGPFTKEEYTEVMNGWKGGKVCGSDGILPEVFKHCELDDVMIIRRCNELGNKHLDGQTPDQLSKNDLKPFPKSRDLSNTEKYRGIALTTAAATNVNKLILNRIRSMLGQYLRVDQNGFRPGRFTFDSVHHEICFKY